MHLDPGGTTDFGLKGLKLRQFRLAIQRNAVSFPSQTPGFAQRPGNEIQWRMAHLFFVAGWSLVALGQRYKIPPWRVGMLVRDWMQRAVAFGYVQDIPSEESIAFNGEKPTVEFRRYRAMASSMEIDISNDQVASAAIAEDSQGSRRLRRSTDAEVAAALEKFYAGMGVEEICRTAGITRRTFYAWKSRFGDMTPSEISELRRLREENRLLRSWSTTVTLMLARGT